jgi:hypothetical protein
MDLQICADPGAARGSRGSRAPRGSESPSRRPPREEEKQTSEGKATAAAARALALGNGEAESETRAGAGAVLVIVEWKGSYRPSRVERGERREERGEESYVHLVPCEPGGQVSRPRRGLRGHRRSACRGDCACGEVAQGMGWDGQQYWLVVLSGAVYGLATRHGLPTPRDDALAIGSVWGKCVLPRAYKH